MASHDANDVSHDPDRWFADVVTSELRVVAHHLAEAGADDAALPERRHER